MDLSPDIQAVPAQVDDLAQAVSRSAPDAVLATLRHVSAEVRKLLPDVDGAVAHILRTCDEKSGVELDGDGVLDDDLSATAHALRRVYAAVRRVRRQTPFLRRIRVWLVVSPLLSDLRRLHDRIEHARVYLAEHDADAAPTGPPIAGVDALRAHLQAPA